MNPILDLWVPALLVLMMIVVGMGLTRDDFQSLKGRVGVVAGATLAQILLLPLIAGVMVMVFQPDTSTAVGLILLSVCPGGAISNFYAHLTRANVALSVTLTAISSMTCLVTTPVGARLACSLFLAETTDVEVPVARILIQLGLFVLVPIALGMWWRATRPELAGRWIPGLNRISIAALALLLIAILFDQRGSFGPDVGKVIGLAIAFTIACAGVGAATASILRIRNDEMMSLALEFSVRNLAVMALIAISILGEIEYLFLGAVFFVVQMPVVLVTVGILRRLLGRRAVPDA